jgi:hypothetical protein
MNGPQPPAGRFLFVTILHRGGTARRPPHNPMTDLVKSAGSFDLRQFIGLPFRP